MKNDPFVYKPSGDDRISGWLLLFLVAASLGAAASCVLFFTDFNMEDYSWAVSRFASSLLATMDIMFTMSIVAFGFFMVYSFVKRNPNAPVYGILYCSFLFYSNIIFIVLNFLANDSTDIPVNGTRVIRSLVWSVVWILFLIFSEQVKTLFPKENRKLPNSVLLVTAAIVAFPVLIFVVSVYIAAGIEY